MYLILVQYMKHRMQMQITQELWEYDLSTNSVQFMQQTTSPLSEADISARRVVRPTAVYHLTNCPKVKARGEKSISDTNTSSQTFTPFTGASFISDCLLQPFLHINYALLEFTDITDPLLSTAALFSRFYSHKIQSELLRRPHIL